MSELQQRAKDMINGLSDADTMFLIGIITRLTSQDKKNKIFKGSNIVKERIKRSISGDLSPLEESEEARLEFGEAFYDLREEAKDLPEMTLEEINNEIVAARAERKRA